MSSFQGSNRRDFLRTSFIIGSGLLTGPSLFAAGPRPNARFGGVQIGAITYSFRSLPVKPDDIIRYCQQCGLNALELKGDTAEPFAGSPSAAKIREWRETVGMEKFEELRKMFKKAGISIYAYKPNALNETNSDGEIEHAMKAAKALGASSVTVELPKNPAHSKRLADIAAKYKMYVGYHAHTQATDTAWDEALAQSPWNTLNLDCGHYIAAGGQNTAASLLALIEAKHERISSLHLKDRRSKENGAANVEWGKGDTPIIEILKLMKEKKYRFPVSIELEYPIPAGSDAVKEVTKCVAYAKAALS
jgi:sugar phosphate isomerase/epimerase